MNRLECSGSLACSMHHPLSSLRVQSLRYPRGGGNRHKTSHGTADHASQERTADSAEAPFQVQHIRHQGRAIKKGASVDAESAFGTVVRVSRGGKSLPLNSLSDQSYLPTGEGQSPQRMAPAKISPGSKKPTTGPDNAIRLAEIWMGEGEVDMCE